MKNPPKKVCTINRVFFPKCPDFDPQMPSNAPTVHAFGTSMLIFGRKKKHALGARAQRKTPTSAPRSLKTDKKGTVRRRAIACFPILGLSERKTPYTPPPLKPWPYYIKRLKKMNEKNHDQQAVYWQNDCL